MARKRKESGLLAIALQGRWTIAAAMTGFFLILAYIVLPPILGGNRITAPLIGAFRAPMLIVAFATGAIALVKYLREKQQVKSQPFQKTELCLDSRQIALLLAGPVPAGGKA